MSRLSDRPLSDRPVSVVPAPEPAADPDQRYLDRVDARLEDCLAELDRAWRASLEGTREVAVLGRFDLPVLLRQTLNGGGKRIRPLMTRLGWAAAGGRPETTGADHAVLLGTALDLLHSFALVHDDVMDASARRRGRPTIHVLAAALHEAAGGTGDPRRFGESIAILLGDLALAEAGHLVGELPTPLRRRWREMTVELVCGQRADLTGSAVPEFDPAAARRVGRLKSGCYTIQRPLELGAAAAGAEPAAIGLLSTYGHELGTAFALRDDVLGVWGDPQVTGKPAGDDLISGKPTMIIALAARQLDDVGRELLGRVGTPELTPADVTALQHTLRECGIADEIERRISDHVARALDALDAAVLDAAAVSGLARMAHRIAWRDR